MDLLNSEFAEMNLCFELKGYEEINDDDIYFTSAGIFRANIRDDSSKRDENSINIYIPYRFTNYNNGLRGFMFGYNPNYYNKMAVNSYEYNTGIFIHEMGHVLGLRHTHAGCENVTRDPSDPNYNAEC